MAVSAQEACSTLAEFSKPPLCDPDGRDAHRLAGLVMVAVSAAQAAVKAVNATAQALIKARECPVAPYPAPPRSREIV